MFPGLPIWNGDALERQRTAPMGQTFAAVQSSTVKMRGYGGLGTSPKTFFRIDESEDSVQMIEMRFSQRVLKLEN